jgi:hypothetical protein
MTNQHPITPPPELVNQWCDEDPGGFEMFDRLATKAARWGADQELEACCSEVAWLESTSMAKKIRDRRRPKPPTLKEQALDALELFIPFIESENKRAEAETIRKALEALPND